MGVNLSIPATQSYSSGGGSNSSASMAQNFSDSWANTAGAAASQFSAQQAAIARAFSAEQARIQREWQEAMFQKEMEYNSSEALKAREWNQANIDIANKMANTVYSRSVADMRAAGINPILAAQFGLSAAGSGSVTSGAGASASAPSGAMGQSFMGNALAEQNSGSHSEGSSESWGKGSSWQNSESGLATLLSTMGSFLKGITDGINAGNNISISFDGLKALMQNPKVEKAAESISGAAAIAGGAVAGGGNKSIIEKIVDEAKRRSNKK